MDAFFQVLLLLLLLSGMTPYFQQRKLAYDRARRLAALEAHNNSRAITLIHRQEAISLLGIPISRFISVDDSEEVLRAIRQTPDDTPIDLVLHTPGGLVLASEQISEALAHHPAHVTVYIPHYAMSGGTLIALGADTIVMDKNAVVGPVDPQVGSQFTAVPAASVLTVVDAKPISEIDDATLILADQSRKALAQMFRTVHALLARRFPDDRARELAEMLSQGRWTHDYPISASEFGDLGFEVRTDMPGEVYELMTLYPQPRGRVPNVQYLPREGRPN